MIPHLLHGPPKPTHKPAEAPTGTNVEREKQHKQETSRRGKKILSRVCIL